MKPTAQNSTNRADTSPPVFRATSSDTNYNGVNAADVVVSNIDDDASGVTIVPTSGLTTSEAGGTATFTVVLTAQGDGGVYQLEVAGLSDGRLSGAQGLAGTIQRGQWQEEDQRAEAAYHQLANGPLGQQGPEQHPHR